MSDYINKVLHCDGDKIIEELCAVPVEATIDCGGGPTGRNVVEMIFTMLREYGAVVVFNVNQQDKFSLLQLGADLAANAKVDGVLHDAELQCFHPRLYVTHLLGKGGATSCPECKALVVVDKEGRWQHTPATYAVLSDGRCCNCEKTVESGTRHLHIVVGRNPYTTKMGDCYVARGPVCSHCGETVRPGTVHETVHAPDSLTCRVRDAK